MPTKDLPDPVIADFVAREDLPANFATAILEHHVKIAACLAHFREKSGRTIFIGINGAQGSGKTTLANSLKILLNRHYGLNTAVISIDDLYLGKAERLRLARRVHPCLATRGVPGTHDVALGTALFDSLSSAGPQDITLIPRFDKAKDDRLPPQDWQRFSGRADIVILEGWCVGVTPQTEAALRDPVNELELMQDPEGLWRRYANDQLAGVYQPFFARLDKLILLQIPDFDCAFNWRMTQERKLWAKKPKTGAAHSGANLLDPEALRQFMMHYERLTRRGQASLPGQADIILQIDADHQLQNLQIKPDFLEKAIGDRAG